MLVKRILVVGSPLASIIHFKIPMREREREGSDNTESTIKFPESFLYLAFATGTVHLNYHLHYL